MKIMVKHVIHEVGSVKLPDGCQLRLQVRRNCAESTFQTVDQLIGQ
jgi:hypothetical protein